MLCMKFAGENEYLAAVRKVVLALAREKLVSDSFGAVQLVS